jgi:hypothetical protein
MLDIDIDRFLLDRDPSAYNSSARCVIRGRRFLADWRREQHG